MGSFNYLNYTLVRLLQWTKKYTEWIYAIPAIILYCVLYPKLVDRTIVKFLSGFLQIKSAWVYDLFFGSLAAGSVLSIYAVLYLRKDRVKRSYVSYYPTLVTLAYLLPRLDFLHTTTTTLTPFTFWVWLTYGDAVFLLVLQFVIRITLQKQLRPPLRYEGIPEVLEDDFYGLGGIDILRRTNYARFIAKIIANKKTKSAFAISIKGDWGSGKSVFLRQIKQTLGAILQIDFNPWLSKSAKHIIPDFFRLLIGQTIDYDRRLSRRFERYSEALTRVDEKFSEKLFSTIGLIHKSLKEEGLEVQAREIVHILRKEKLKIVVFIDDLDRLGGDEIMAVLKLIRNSFNFPNTFFLVACDDRYVQKTIGDLVENPSRFLEKIFQLEIDLPSFPIEVVEQQVSDLLTRGKTAYQLPALTAALSYIFSAKVAMNKIRNIRDAIRLANSVNHIYDNKCDQVDLVDFLLLEVLKVKRKEIYSDIREALMRNYSLPYLIVPKSGPDRESGAVQYGRASQERDRPPREDEEFLDILFNRKSNFDEIKSIRFLRNSIRYFSDDLFGNISYTDFDHIRDESFDRTLHLIDQNWESNLEQLTALLLRASPRLSVYQFKNLMKGLLYISNRRDDQAYTRALTGIIESAQTAFPMETFEPALQEVLVDDRQDAFAESAVLGELLRVAINNPKNEFPGKERVTRWLLRNLETFIGRHVSQFDKRVFGLYYPLIDHNEEGNSVMNSDANSLLKDYILANPAGYFQEWLIRPKSSSLYKDMYVLEPFIDQYLGYDEFERLLYCQEQTWAVTKLQGFFTMFKKENYTECTYHPKITVIFSDEHTRFDHSPTYPTFPSEGSATTVDKMAESDKFPELNYSQWITRKGKLTLKEAINGGEYHFIRTFTLPLSEKPFKAKIYCLVDDEISFTINHKAWESQFNGWHELHTLEIGNLLLPGENEIIFVVKNVSMSAQVIADRPENNPYEFIYAIQIWEDKTL